LPEEERKEWLIGATRGEEKADHEKENGKEIWGWGLVSVFETRGEQKGPEGNLQKVSQSKSERRTKDRERRGRSSKRAVPLKKSPRKAVSDYRTRPSWRLSLPGRWRKPGSHLGKSPEPRGRVGG